MRPEARGAIGASELQRARRRLRWRQPQRYTLGCVRDEPGDRFTILEADEPPAHQLPAGFGVQIPASPGRALLRNRLHHGLPDFVHHVQRHVVGAQQPSRRLTAEQGARPAGRIRAEQPGCALAPVAGEVRQRLDLLLRSRGERLLGAQFQHHSRRGLPAMPGDVLGDQSFLLDLDMLRASGELGHQLVGYAFDFPRWVAVAAPLPCFPSDAQGAGQSIGQSRVV